MQQSTNKKQISTTGCQTVMGAMTRPLDDMRKRIFHHSVETFIRSPKSGFAAGMVAMSMKATRAEKDAFLQGISMGIAIAAGSDDQEFVAEIIRVSNLAHEDCLREEAEGQVIQ